ncbi:hypothetical protein D9B87_11040 [Corynebacterium diphtheriae]|nr:hypothetical protein D9B87_11040 [Corynebacterium diphtheriae]
MLALARIRELEFKTTKPKDGILARNRVLRFRGLEFEEAQKGTSAAETLATRTRGLNCGDARS